MFDQASPAGPQARLLGSHRIHLDAVDSTNAYAWQLLRRAQAQRDPAPPEGTAVLAHHQYAGRGQRGTEWVAAPGENLTLSLVLYPRGVQAGSLFLLHKAFALAVAHTLEEALGPTHPVAIKWPNDILVGGRKACGILVENQLAGTAVEATVLGIGLNVNQTAFPPELATRATSLAQVLGRRYPLGPLTDALLAHLEAQYLPLRHHRALDAAHHALLDRAYLQRLYRYQEWAPFQVGAEQFEGMIVGVTREGRLALQRAQGLAYYDFKEVAFG